jgi:hypothetical protein
MRPFSARDVEAALLRKGFTARESHHTMFHFIHDGKDVGVSTKISHGEREIGIGLVKRMRAQMRLRTNTEFQRFVECPMTKDEYEQVLCEEGVLRQPIT